MQDDQTQMPTNEQDAPQRTGNGFMGNEFTPQAANNDVQPQDNALDDLDMPDADSAQGGEADENTMPGDAEPEDDEEGDQDEDADTENDAGSVEQVSPR